MAKPDFGCGREECSASTNIADEVTFGTGELDSNGFFEIPCPFCLIAWKMSEK